MKAMKMNICSRFAISCLSATRLGTLFGARLGRKYALALALLPFLATASAQSVWDGGSLTTNNWNDAANWDGNVAPVASITTDLQFDGTTQLSAINNFAPASLFGSIAFNSLAGAFTLSGNQIGTGNNNYAITNNSSQIQTVNINYALGTAGSFTLTSAVAGGTLVYGGSVSGGHGNVAVNHNFTNPSGASTIRIGGNSTGIAISTFSSLNNQVNMVQIASDTAITGSFWRAGGAQFMAHGGNRSINGTASMLQSTIGMIIAGENNLTFNGALAVASNFPNSAVLLNAGSTTILSGGITANAASQTVALAGAGNVDITGNISGNGTANMTWANSQTLSLSGTNAGLGAMGLHGGQVTLNYGTNDTSKLSNGALTLGGSKLTLTGGTHADAVASTTLAQGASTITRSSGSNASLTLNLITRANGNGGTLALAADGLATTDTSNVNEILGGYALVGNNWAVNSSGGPDGAINGLGLGSYESDINFDANTNQNVAVTGSESLTANRTHNTLKITTSGSGQSLDIGAAQSLSVKSGGLLFAGSNDYAINSGTFGVGASAVSANDLKVFVTGTGNLEINSIIANGLGANGLTKAGSGTLILGGTNTYTGATILTQGTVQIAAASALGNGTILAFNGGSLATTADFTLTRTGAISLGIDGGTLNVASGTTLTLGSNLVNSAVATNVANTILGSLTKSGAGTLVTTASNTYTGATVLNAGVLSVSSIRDGAQLYSGNYSVGGSAASGIGASTSSYRNLVLNGGTLRYTGAGNSSNRGFTIGANGGTLDASGSGALNLTGNDIFLSGTDTARSLTLTGSNTGNNILAGVLADNGSGQTALVKSGAGQWELSATNTYTGTTTVSDGTLVLRSTGSIASTQIGFGVTDLASGLLTVENTSFAFGGTLDLSLSSVTVNNGSWTLFNGSAFGAGDLNLAFLTNNIGGLNFTNSSGIWTGTGGGSRIWTFDEDLGQLTVVPEPAAGLLLAVSLILIVTLRYRRRRA